MKATVVGRVAVALVLLSTIFVFGCSSDSSSSPTPVPTPSPVAFIPNTFSFWDNPQNWTTSYGPAYANILLSSSNFVPCLGGPFALCYYSGPQPDNCTLTADGRFADCECFQITYGQYFVDINAILNYSVYQQTVAACGADGSQCQQLNSAPVCQSINQGTLIPGSDMVSTFSFDCVPSNGIGQTNCGKSVYAGCMTAPCYGGEHNGLITCQCPTYKGPFQVGENNQQCTLGDELVWSAAYAPPSPSPAATSAAEAVTSAISYPQPGVCLPDAPGGYGCPLYVAGQTLPANSGVDCTKVCTEYATCINLGEQAGFTCDSALCTRECNDDDLISQACTGLAQCDISEIAKAEQAAQCSCCASQLCGCTPDSPTNLAIAGLNQLQRARGITPQCDINGTLCGTP